MHVNLYQLLEVVSVLVVAYRQKNSLKESVLDVVKNTLLQTAFSAILPTGQSYNLHLQECCMNGMKHLLKLVFNIKY